MDVLYVGPVPPLRGGIAQHGRQIVAALREAGHRVSVLTWAAQYPQRLYRGAQRESGRDFESGVEPILKWYSPWSWWRARQIAATHDLVVIQWVHPFHALPLRVVLGGARGRGVAIVHNARPHERLPFDDALTRFALRHAGRIVTHAGHQAAVIGSILPTSEIVVTPHPPNLAPASVNPPPGPPWRLLFAGFVRRYKGVDVAIEALAELIQRDHDVSLTVAGSFWEPLNDYQAVVDRFRVGAHVALLDHYLSDDELVRTIGSHHVLVAPYRSATQSGLIPMALAVGRPIVATAVGGLAAQIPPGAGAIAPAEDSIAFADAIERVLASYSEFASSAAGSAPSWAGTVAAIVGGVS